METMIVSISPIDNGWDYFSVGFIGGGPWYGTPKEYTWDALMGFLVFFGRMRGAYPML